ncbi:hypothetical protein ACZ75_17825 [Massilia sp. NR 4-1]|nr:hypothetical protein ACZ75_17825 [Massilia sp. NR 4-1]
MEQQKTILLLDQMRLTSCMVMQVMMLYMAREGMIRYPVARELMSYMVEQGKIFLSTNLVTGTTLFQPTTLIIRIFKTY